MRTRALAFILALSAAPLAPAYGLTPREAEVPWAGTPARPRRVNLPAAG